MTGNSLTRICTNRTRIQRPKIITAKYTKYAKQNINHGFIGRKNAQNAQKKNGAGTILNNKVTKQTKGREKTNRELTRSDANFYRKRTRPRLIAAKHTRQNINHGWARTVNPIQKPDKFVNARCNFSLLSSLCAGIFTDSGKRVCERCPGLTVHKTFLRARRPKRQLWRYPTGARLGRVQARPLRAGVPVNKQDGSLFEAH